MSKLKTRQTGTRLLAAWGGSLGFVVGAAAMAEIAKRLGWWPPSENRLRRYARHDTRWKRPGTTDQPK